MVWNRLCIAVNIITSKFSGLKTRKKLYFPTHFLWGRNSIEAWLVGSGLNFLMRCSCLSVGLQSFEGLLGGWRILYLEVSLPWLTSWFCKWQEMSVPHPQDLSLGLSSPSHGKTCFPHSDVMQEKVFCFLASAVTFAISTLFYSFLISVLSFVIVQ